MNISSALKPSQRWSMTARRRPIIRRRRRPAARRPAHCRLRQDSVADDHRLQSNYSRHSGDQPRNRLFAFYLPDRVSLIRSMRENGLNTKVCCGMTTGAQSDSIKTSMATSHPPRGSASQPPDVVDYERTAGLEQLIGARRANIARRQ